MDPLPRIVAHAGLYGALAESAIILVFALLVGWVWWRERRQRRLRGDRHRASMRE